MLKKKHSEDYTSGYMMRCIDGYKEAIEKAKQWIKDNYWTCSSAEECSEDFVKFMDN